MFWKSSIFITASLPFALLLPSEMHAQTAAQPNYLGCADITSDASRLRCFDEAVRREKFGPAKQTTNDQPASTTAVYQSFDLTDLKLDYQTLKGKKVATSGNLLVFANVLLLRQDAGDTNSFFVEYARVPREQRRDVLQRCTGLGCQADIVGTVGSVLGQSGIIAEGISIRD